jgi:hypothetical protein
MARDTVADSLWITNIIDRVLSMKEVLHIHRACARTAATGCIRYMTNLAGFNRIVVARTMLRSQFMAIIAALDVD